MTLGKYTKAIVAAVGLALTVLNLLVGDNHTLQVVIAMATAAGVHQFANVDTGLVEVAHDVEHPNG